MKKLYQKACLFLVIFCSGSHIGYAQTTQLAPKTKFDSLDQIVNVWYAVDPSTSFYKIQGNYNGGPTLDLTDPNTFICFNPILAAARSSSGTTAIAVWAAYDISNSKIYIQAATASSSGWNNSTIHHISAIDGSEAPSTDYHVDISPDGQKISIVWSSSISSGETVIRINTSTDGGANWSGPTTI